MEKTIAPLSSAELDQLAILKIERPDYLDLEFWNDLTKNEKQYWFLRFMGKTNDQIKVLLGFDKKCSRSFRYLVENSQTKLKNYLQLKEKNKIPEKPTLDYCNSDLKMVQTR